MTTGVGGVLVKEVLPDRSVVTVSRLWTEHRDASGVLLAAREPNADELADLDAREAAQGGLDVWGPVEQAERDADRALGPHRAEIRAAAARLRQIETQGVALAESPAPPTSTAAEVKAAVDAQAVQIRAISRAASDMAAYLLEVGRVVLRDVT